MDLTKEQLERAAFFAPCQSKEHLQLWIKRYLGLDLPDGIVCDDDVRHEPSNSSPIDLIWEIYAKAIYQIEPDSNRILAYAARAAFKTLSSSIIELLMLFHGKRDVAHMAAEVQQSSKSASNLSGFFSRPILKDFITSSNVRTIEVTWYTTPDGKRFFTPREYKEGQRNGETWTERLQEHSYSMQIIVATVKGSNSAHVPFLCVDGKTEILVRVPGQEIKPTSARSLFEILSGDSTSDVVLAAASSSVEILAADPTNGRIKMCRVLAAGRKLEESGLRLTFSNATELVVGPEHPVWVKGRGFVKASKIAIRDEVLEIGGTRVLVERIEEIGVPRWMYDFTVEEFHTFYANGILVHNCLDELDLVPPKPFAEAMMIPTPTREGHLPIIFMTSSRKISSGPVQKEIDSAKETGTLIRHWNYLDVTKPCPPERHLPGLPKIPIFFNEDTLRAIDKSSYDQLSDKEKEKWLSQDGYQGCVSNCSMFAHCLGRLATKQKSKSSLLSDVRFTASQFKAFANDPDTARAQLLCWEPESGALIFGRLNKSRHLKTASQIAELATGNPMPHIRTRQQLFGLLKELGSKFASGMDFGFTHNFAVITAAIYGNKAYIINAFELQGLEINEKLEICETMLRPYDSIIHPDQAYPSDIKTFRKAGYVMTNFKKDISLGIDAARSKITPSDDAEPELVFLDDSNEEGRVMTAFTKISRYEYELDANGKPTDQPKEEDDDLAAAFRYLCQQEFGKHLGKAHKDDGRRNPNPLPVLPQDQARQQVYQTWMKNEIAEATQGGTSQEVTVKKGKFFFGA